MVRIATARNRTGTLFVVVVIVTQARLLDRRRKGETTAGGIVKEVVARHGWIDGWMIGKM